MTGKELVIAAIERRKVSRIPWVPFCGIHTASLMGKTATEYLKSSDLIVKGLNEAVKRYKPDGIPVIFDLQLEAEIFGCELNWSDDNPPAVVSHPIADGAKKLEDLKLPTASDGRIPVVVEALKTLRAQHPDIALYGLITGPFTLALHLLGTEIFMGMFDNPEGIKQTLDFCAEVGKRMSEIYIKNGCDVIAVVDPMTSQIGPDQFEEFCNAPSVKVFEHIRSLGAKSSFFVCGHAQNNIEAMCGTHCDSISIDENIPLDYVKDICQRKKVAFGGNMKLTTVMLLGTPEQNKQDAIECMDIGGFEGFILAPGCDMPYATPPANVEAIAEIVHDPYKLQIARELKKTAFGAGMKLVDIKEHLKGSQVKIDIVTLDSEGCAPCQYMVEAVKAATAEFGSQVVWKEHKVKNVDGIAMMVSLGVKNIPTVCIDGKIAFISRIPPKEEIAKAVKDAIEARKAN